MSSAIKLCNKKDFDKHIEIIPSTTIYFNVYPYKVDIKGPGYPHPDYDVDMQYEITDFMKTCNMFYKREYQSKLGRSIYLGSHEDLMWLTNWMGKHIRAVHGPVSDKHLLHLRAPSIVLRNNLFYRRYDYRIEFYVKKQWNRWGSNFTFTPKSEQEADDSIKNLLKFVAENFDDYRWATGTFVWYYNYLYCKKEEYDQIKGYLALTFKDLITEQVETKLFSDL